MSPTVAKLVEASQALSVEDRMELFDALWDMVDVPAGTVEFELSPEDRAELDRRWEAYRQNPETAVGWEEAKRRMSAIRDQL